MRPNHLTTTALEQAADGPLRTQGRASQDGRDQSRQQDARRDRVQLVARDSINLISSKEERPDSGSAESRALWNLRASNQSFSQRRLTAITH